MNWEDIKWIKSITKLPVLVKGILHEDDAEMAVECGVDGLMVSNHGGRQGDYAIASLNALPAIVRRVNGRIPVIVDGGIRGGSDILKALALGADAVMVGRPFLYALACGGEEFVQKSIDLLRIQLEHNMALNGITDVRQARSVKLVGNGCINL